MPLGLEIHYRDGISTTLNSIVLSIPTYSITRVVT